jgi:hypothetical protein
MCSSKPLPLIALFNAVKEQPAFLAIAAGTLAFRSMAIAPKRRKRWLIPAVPRL